VVWN